MKSIIDILVSLGLLVTFTVGVNKFYHALEKELVIKLSKGLPSLSHFNKRLTRSHLDLK
ncbi:MAG: hypothetical protein HQK49_12670 [Oligoflexia bacterium]|nr:hypothetical protein [Oligoflexia bacterium]